MYLKECNLIELVFTKKEIRLIEKKFTDLDIANTDYDFLNKEYIDMSSKSYNHFIVENGTQSYTYSWTTNNVPTGGIDVDKSTPIPIKGLEKEFDNHMKLVEFEEYIMSIIKEKGLIK
ncbi:MAG: hypothetical protein JEZ08_20625 [Clostridiales bacterium]|nr:hypothetical protein [Clostridiales bacterium]